MKKKNVCSTYGGVHDSICIRRRGNSQRSGPELTLTLYGNADDLAKPYMQKIISLWEESSGNKIDQQGLDTRQCRDYRADKILQLGDIRIFIFISETAI
ncbi:MAG: hypothetical protein ACLSBD_07485 [Blautia massiliensis (ex Durand et al. 2017)]